MIESTAHDKEYMLETRDPFAELRLQLACDHTLRSVDVNFKEAELALSVEDGGDGASRTIGAYGSSPA
jgi:hypothetical protein